MAALIGTKLSPVLCDREHSSHRAVLSVDPKHFFARHGLLKRPAHWGEMELEGLGSCSRCFKPGPGLKNWGFLCLVVWMEHLSWFQQEISGRFCLSVVV